MPLDGDGYRQPGLRAAYLDGVSLAGVLVGRGFEAPGGGPNLIPNAAGGHVEQYSFPGGTGPVSKRAGTGTLPCQDASEEAFHAAIRSTLRVVEYWPDLPLSEIFIAVAGQILFSLSRPHGYGAIPGVTTLTHPVLALLNGVEQSVIYGADPEPEAGEVGVVTTTRVQWRAIVTPPLAAADLLEIRFYPLCRVKATLQGQHEEQGKISYSLAIEESLAGRWD
jgi:hypothetical protein